MLGTFKVGDPRWVYSTSCGAKKTFWVEPDTVYFRPLIGVILNIHLQLDSRGPYYVDTWLGKLWFTPHGCTVNPFYIWGMKFNPEEGSMWENDKHHMIGNCGRDLYWPSMESTGILCFGHYLFSTVLEFNPVHPKKVSGSVFAKNLFANSWVNPLFN